MAPDSDERTAGIAPTPMLLMIATKDFAGRDLTKGRGFAGVAGTSFLVAVVALEADAPKQTVRKGSTGPHLPRKAPTAPRGEMQRLAAGATSPVGENLPLGGSATKTEKAFAAPSGGWDQTDGSMIQLKQDYDLEQPLRQPLTEITSCY